VINLATPILSTRSLGTLYTAQGLGDRIHLISVAHQISLMLSSPVSIHLCLNHLGRNKRDSFEEILTIFNNPQLSLTFHKLSFNSDGPWVDYLNSHGISPSTIAYPDHPGWLERTSGIDVPKFLRKRHLIQPKCQEHEINTPENFIVSQWDGSGSARKINESVTMTILDNYKKLGLQNIIVGGEAEVNELRDCLACIGELISKSKFYVGIDSGFMHYALQIKKYEEIHIYNSYRNYWSHHLLRAREVGVRVNPYVIPQSILGSIYVRFRYDSVVLAKTFHGLKLGVKKLLKWS
jgi:hypothetical protein